MEILDSIVGTRTEVDATRRQRQDVLVGCILLMWEEPDEQYLTNLNECVKNWKTTGESELVEMIKKLRGYAQTAQVDKFMDECGFIVALLQCQPPENARKNFGRTLIRARWQTSYESFIELAFRVMSREKISGEMSSMYNRFVWTIVSLCKKSIVSITSHEELQTSRKCVLPCIHGTVMYLKDQEDKRRLPEAEHINVEATTNGLPDVRRAYPDLDTGISRVDRFLHSRNIVM